MTACRRAFPPPVVFEECHVVGRGLDAKNEAVLVVHLDRSGCSLLRRVVRCSRASVGSLALYCAMSIRAIPVTVAVLGILNAAMEASHGWIIRD